MHARSRSLPIAWGALMLVALLGSACGPALPNGALRCAADPARPCPRGYHCESDGACWRDGTGPATDLGPTDAGEGDLPEAPDLAPPPKMLGAACGAAEECASGHCTDQVCCDVACDEGPCRSCIAEGSVGTCSTVTGGAIGGRKCAGDATGACAGTCDGIKAACSFPPSATGCGSACNGTCDGAGVCSVQGTGSCPNGYVCGGATCKTSCAGPADCQPFFGCSGNQCQRIPEADCLDGLDNNGDGLKDCEDPSCASVVQCVPEPTVGVKHGYMPSASDACTPTTLFDTAQALYQTLINGGCMGCGCSVTLDCDYAMRFYPVRPNCNDLSGSFRVDGTFTLRWGGSQCDDTGLSGTTSGGSGSSSVRVLGVSGGTPACQQTSPGVRQPAGFASSGTYCSARKTSLTCGAANQVCAPRPPSANKQCVRVPGAGQSCPSGYGDSRYTWHNQALNDTRDCQCQNCMVTSSKTCMDPSLLSLPPIETWQSSTMCAGEPAGAIHNLSLSSSTGESNCEDFIGDTSWPSDLRSARFAANAQTAGTCLITPYLAGGGISTTGDVTVCCQ